jgi:hypothetical protein
MEDKIEVKEIVLNIEGKEIKLSPEKAKELMNALKTLFPDSEKINWPIFIDRWPSYPNPYYGPNWVYNTSTKVELLPRVEIYCTAEYKL